VIKNWSGSTNGGGTDQVYVGTTAQCLTAAQLGRIVLSIRTQCQAQITPPEFEHRRDRSRREAPAQLRAFIRQAGSFLDRQLPVGHRDKC